MKNKLQLLFGDNWRSSTSGVAAVLLFLFSYVIDANPGLVSFLADGIETYVIGVSRLISAVAALYFVIIVADLGGKKGKEDKPEEEKK